MQTIDLDGDEYTEWRFYVTPLREGQYILEVKVAVIELVDGEKELRERVLEEEVQIISRNAAPAAAPDTPFKPAGEALAFAAATGLPPAAPSSTPPLAPQAVSPEPALRRSAGPGRALALFLVFLLAGSGAVWAVPAPVRDWWWAGLRNTAEAYADYIAEHKSDQNPNTRRGVEKAYFKIAEINENPADLRTYLEQYPEGDPALREKALQKVETLEIRALENIRRQPETGAVRQFLQHFPDSKRLPELTEAAAAKPEVLQQVQTDLTRAAAEQTRRRSPAAPTQPETPQLSPAEAADWAAADAANTARAYVDFVNKYPKTTKLPEARARINALKPKMTPEEQAWADATLADNPQAYIYFVQKYPKSRLTTDARQRIKTFSLSKKEQSRLEAETAARLAEEQEAERKAKEAEARQPSNPEPSNQKPSNQQPANPSGRSGLTMVPVKGGTFIMGCQDGRDEDCYSWEKPAHSVTLSRLPDR